LTNYSAIENASHLLALVRLALAEDNPSGDVTTSLTIPPQTRGEAAVKCRSAVVVSGLALAQMAFLETDPTLTVVTEAADGDWLEPGRTLLTVSGRASSILSAERTALNFLGRLSGIATLTRQFVKLAEEAASKKGLPAPKILDTRKTTPGLRLVEKAAVRHGGGRNHRFSLSDGILIKDNHIQAAGSVGEALRRAKLSGPHHLRVEVEVDDLDQLQEALEAGCDIILLDNMTPALLTKAAEKTNSFHAPGPRRTLLEASGGINLKTISEVAVTGVDYISAGALTHSAPSADLGLDWT
jgi:nicotinate-nucleotide pyrophosphorylase (carboxylating)